MGFSVLVSEFSFELLALSFVADQLISYFVLSSGFNQLYRSTANQTNLTN
jgi:hypothetical protein